MRPDQIARNAGRGSLAIGLAGLIALFLVTLFPADLAAQSAGVTRITSSFGTGPKPVGFYEFSGTFTCDYLSGETGPCTGRFVGVERDETCSNDFQFSGDMSITGIDLSRTGPFNGVVTFTHIDFHSTTRPDGSCSFVLGPQNIEVKPFTGTWNGTTGTFEFPTDRDIHGNLIVLTGSFTAYRNAPVPVFPMTVRSNISSTSATATADIQFRPQDVGASGSIYSFAVAPSALVKGGQDAKAVAIGSAW
ncbi:MAG TPA: hypothetical protein VFV55_04640, partial [Usitatibacteraceae bacterium]|nr:hypothetical protein [Usitatibacteraceae bacterium]